MSLGFTARLGFEVGGVRGEWRGVVKYYYASPSPRPSPEGEGERLSNEFRFKMQDSASKWEEYAGSGGAWRSTTTHLPLPEVSGV